MYCNIRIAEIERQLKIGRSLSIHRKFNYMIQGTQLMLVFLAKELIRPRKEKAPEGA